MDIKKIIQEELEDFQWVKDTPEFNVGDKYSQDDKFFGTKIGTVISEMDYQTYRQEHNLTRIPQDWLKVGEWVYLRWVRQDNTRGWSGSGTLQRGTKKSEAIDNVHSGKWTKV